MKEFYRVLLVDVAFRLFVFYVPSVICVYRQQWGRAILIMIFCCVYEILNINRKIDKINDKLNNLK